MKRFIEDSVKLYFLPLTWTYIQINRLLLKTKKDK